MNVLQRGLICLSVLVQPLVAFAQGSSADPNPAVVWGDYEAVSMVQLIAAPQQFEGRKVCVYGFASMQFEDFTVYLTRDDLQHGNGKNGIWLTLERGQKTKRLDGRFVLVFGVFTARDKGHMGANSGALVDIRRIDLVPKRKRK